MHLVAGLSSSPDTQCFEDGENSFAFVVCFGNSSIQKLILFHFSNLTRIVFTLDIAYQGGSPYVECNRHRN